MSNVQFASYLGIGLCVAGVALGLMTPFCARRTYRRTRDRLPGARRLWVRHAVAQELMALFFVSIGLQAVLVVSALQLYLFLSIPLVIGMAVAALTALALDPPGFQLFDWRCRAADAVVRYYDRAHAENAP